MIHMIWYESYDIQHIIWYQVLGLALFLNSFLHMFKSNIEYDKGQNGNEYVSYHQKLHKTFILK